MTPSLKRKLRDVPTQLSPLLALIVVFLGFGLADEAYSRFAEKPAVFLSLENVRTIVAQSVVVGIAALGMLVVIISGGIDLSVGTTIALSATSLAWALIHGFHAVAAVVLGIVVGGSAGLINGLLVSRLRIVPFIVTLGTMTIYLGVAKMISGGTTIRPERKNIPVWLLGLNTSAADSEWLLYPLIPRFAPGVWIFLALAALSAVILRRTVFGRYVFAIGSNEATARLCGLNTSFIKVAVYTLSGFFVGVAGVLHFSLLTNGNPTSGTGIELDVIAAVVVGGASLSGGRGTVLGTIAGAVLMVVISTGCTILEFKDAVQDLALGAIIITAAAFDQLRQRRLAG